MSRAFSPEVSRRRRAPGNPLYASMEWLGMLAARSHVLETAVWENMKVMALDPVPASPAPFAKMPIPLLVLEDLPVPLPTLAW